MERAPLRPVPARPAGPVDPAAAIREVAAALPALAPLEARALALVALADRPRTEVAALLDVEPEELGGLLAAARKELRQTLTPLAGSGWCERAEGLISDRLDGAVPEHDARRLDVHLRNCPRCVEHERRLVQATDALLAGVAPAPPGTAPPGPDAPLTAVPPDAERADGEPEDAAQPDGLPEGAARPDGLPEGAAQPDGLPEGAARPDGLPEEAARPDGLPEDAAAAAPEGAAPAPEGAASPASDQVAAAAEVLVTARTRRQLAAAFTWNGMVALAVILTLAAIALTIAGILGAEL